MFTRKNLRPAFAALAAAAALAGGTAALATPLPPTQTQGTVSYVSGGVDKDSAAAFEAAAKHWPALLEFAVKDRPVNSYLANVKVQVLDAHGRTVLQAVSDGPFLLARLQPGRYDVKATFGGKTLDGTLHVKAGAHAREVFMWPSSCLKLEG